MTITLDDVSCHLRLPITKILLYHSRINRPEELYLMVTYIGANLGDAQQEIYDTRGCHTIFSFLMKNHVKHLNVAMDAKGDDAHVTYHIICALRSYFMVFVGTTIFMTKL